MQILLNTARHADDYQSTAEYLNSVVTEALGPNGDRISRVEALLSDATSLSKGSRGEIQCTLKAQLVGLDRVVVKSHAETTHQAIHRAVGKLERALDNILGKQDPLRRTGRLTVPNRHGSTV